MTDWDELRELTHLVAPPPDFEAMVRVADRRRRRARFAGAALAGVVLVGAAIGIAAIDRTDGPVGPAQDPTGSLTDAPDVAQTLPGPDAGMDFATLDAGRYRIPLSDSLSFDVDVPDRTFAHDDGLFLATGAIVLKTELAGEEYGVPHDPCTDHRIVPSGPTVDDLVEAIRSEPDYQVTQPEPVELGGATGTYLEVRLPQGFDASHCTDGDVRTPGNPGTGITWQPGYRGRWWILDVDGQRVVVSQNCSRCADDDLDRAAATPRSITFTPTP